MQCRDRFQDCVAAFHTDLDLRRVGIFGPVGRARGTEGIGFFELKRRRERPKVWAHDLTDLDRRGGVDML